MGVIVVIWVGEVLVRHSCCNFVRLSKTHKGSHTGLHMLRVLDDDRASNMQCKIHISWGHFWIFAGRAAMSSTSRLDTLIRVGKRYIVCSRSFYSLAWRMCAAC